MKKYTLEIIVFIGGAVVMMLELTGSRVLAPFLGTSIFVWTSLIGIILGSLSLGYWLGGKWADKTASYKVFSKIIFTAALLIALTVLSKNIVLKFIQENIGDIRARAIIATIILFAPASVFLGMISPYAIKLKMKSLNTSGRTVGNLYAISTIGSIVGTFLSGFFLISYFGHTNLILILSITLALSALFVYTEKPSKTKIGITLLLLAYFAGINSTEATYEESGILDIDTEYNRVQIYEDIDAETGRSIRRMSIGKTSSSAMFLDSDELVFNYTKFYRLAKHFKPDLESGLVIGGGAYSYPKDFLDKYPYATLDVVEIDPALTELARKYFGLKDDPGLTIYHEDGRTFLNNTEKKYDVIFGDAFKSFYSIPHQLTTIEAVQKMYDILNKDGIVLTNIISSIEGKTGKFLRAEYATFKEVFPQVYLFPSRHPKNGAITQNIMLVAIKSERISGFNNSDKELRYYLGHLWKNEIQTDMPILTDEFAPVDQYIMELL